MQAWYALLPHEATRPVLSAEIIGGGCLAARAAFSKKELKRESR